MKQVIITIVANFPDDATDEEINLIAGTAEVQVMEPADEEGEGFEWGYPTIVYTKVEVDGIPLA